MELKYKYQCEKFRYLYKALIRIIIIYEKCYSTQNHML